MIDSLPAWFWIPAAIILWTILVCLYIAEWRRRVPASPQLESHIGHVPPATRDRSTSALALHRVRATRREGAEVARRAPHPSIEGRTHYTTEHGSCARALQPQSGREARSESHERPTPLEQRGA